MATRCFEENVVGMTEVSGPSKGIEVLVGKRGVERDGRLATSLAALPAELATTGNGGTTLRAFDGSQRRSALLTESCTAGIRCLTTGTGDDPDVSRRNSAVVDSGRCAAASAISSSVPPSMAIVTLTFMMIVSAVVTTMPAFTMMATQQHVKKSHTYPPFRD